MGWNWSCNLLSVILFQKYWLLAVTLIWHFSWPIKMLCSWIGQSTILRTKSANQKVIFVNELRITYSWDPAYRREHCSTTKSCIGYARKRPGKIAKNILPTLHLKTLKSLGRLNSGNIVSIQNYSDPSWRPSIPFPWFPRSILDRDGWINFYRNHHKLKIQFIRWDGVCRCDFTMFGPVISAL